MQHIPEQAIDGLNVAADLQATLFAAEPMVFNPTNIDVDYRGRVWVMEGFNYRVDENPQNPVREEGDRIVILEDEDGDGRAERETVFYQGRDVDAAMGLLVIGNRVIVAAYDRVLVFTDTDGDDRADERQVLFTGLAESHNDHAVHAFVFGPDGKLYFNMGNGGSQVLDSHGNPVVDMAGNIVSNRAGTYRQGMVFRMNPDGSDFEVLGDNFRNNYELAVDSYGTIWQSDNDDDGNYAVRINFVMEYGDFGFTDQMTGAGWRTTRTNMEPAIPDRHWHQNDPGVIPNVLITGAGSPAGILIYEGDHLPERFRHSLIHADAGPNVVRAYPLGSEGAGYTASIEPMLTGVRDQWFRPVDVATAPDGSVFAADWYDPVLGGHQADDVESGRIFRIARLAADYRVPTLSFDTPDAAADALLSPNLDARYRAWTALHRWQSNAEPALARLFEEHTLAPHLRARALWLLAKIEGRSQAWIERGLADANADIRVTAVRAARQAADGRLLDYLSTVIRDDSPAVRREAAIALRFLQGARADSLWAQLALQHDGSDRWYLEALGIGADLYWETRFAAWVDSVGEDWSGLAGRDLVWRSRAPHALPLLGELIRDAETDSLETLRYFRAFDFHTAPGKQDVLLSLLAGSHPRQNEISALALRHLDASALSGDEAGLEEAVDQALASSKGTPIFIDIVRKFERRDQVEALLEYAIQNSTESTGGDAVRLAAEFGGLPRIIEMTRMADELLAERAVSILAHLNTEESPIRELLIDAIYSSDRPLAIRRAAVRSYGDGYFRVRRLMDLVRERGMPDELKPTAASLLLNAHQDIVREEAARLLELPGVERTVVQSPRQLVAHQGDAAKGKQVFSLQCAACHVVGGSGIAFGPDLTGIGSKLPREGLYDAILFPSAGIAHGYAGVVIETTDGGRYAGYVESETTEGVVLRMPGGLSRSIPRTDITARSPMTESLMPPLGQALSQQEVIDLVEFLSGLRAATGE